LLTLPGSSAAVDTLTSETESGVPAATMVCGDVFVTAPELGKMSPDPKVTSPLKRVVSKTSPAVAVLVKSAVMKIKPPPVTGKLIPEAVQV